MGEILEATRIVGYALIHFAWQGTLLGAAAAGALRLCRQRSAEARYAVACLSLVAMLVTPLVTVGTLSQSASPLALVRHGFQPAAAPGTPPVVDTDRALDGHASTTVGRARVERSLPYLVLAWALGVALLLGRMAGGLWRVHRLHAAALAQAASRWQATGERLAARLGLRVPPHVVDSALAGVPAALGWLRPVVLLPIASLANLTPLQVEALLAHELAHLRRNDYVVNLLQSLAETLLFYHPAVWWISSRIRLEREQCCDDVAVKLCGDAVDYAAALTELEAWRTEGARLAPAATGGPLGARVRRLLSSQPDHEPRRANGFVVGGLTVALVAGAAQVSVLISPRRVLAQAARSQSEEPIASPARFGWQTRATEHFTIYYYAALAGQLPLVEVAAEQAHQRVSAELGQSAPFKVPLVLFKTRSDFEQQGIAPGVSMKWVTSFSEPVRNRIVLLVEEGRDLYPRITHELVHIVMFQVIPRDPGPSRRIPLWIDEGLAEYVAGVWAADELLELRQLVASGVVPNLSALAPNDRPSVKDGVSPIRRQVLLGHAAFDFVESRYGGDAVRQFPQELRRDLVDGAGDFYRGAFQTTPGEFDDAFRQYLQRRFGGGSPTV